MISFRHNSGPHGKNLGMTFCIARQHFVPVAQYESAIRLLGLGSPPILRRQPHSDFFQKLRCGLACIQRGKFIS